jgi:hypothetical protein
MTKNSELEKIMNELSASLSEDSRDAMMRRINTERLIKLIINGLAEKHNADSIRVLPDSRMTEQDAADYLIQVDDYDLRVVLLNAIDGNPLLTEKNVIDWILLLESNPNTIALIVVWTNDDLSAIPFSMRRLKAILETPNQIPRLIKTAKPFELIISDIIQRQTKGWKIPEIQKSETTTTGRDLFSIFSEKIIRSIDNEANRRYLIKERVQAAEKFPYETEKRTILSILQEALDGEPAEELKKHLTTISRRGEQ